MTGTLREANGSTPVPDPTDLTQQAVDRSERSIHEWVEGQLARRDERLSGIDTATTLRLATIDHLPDRIKEEVGHAIALAAVQSAADARFGSAQVAHLREVDDIRFQAAERLAARESELNALALAAAFAAQKEASAKEAEYTRIASAKSESATGDAIDKLGVLFATQFGGLADKVDDIKDRVGRIESGKAGATEQRTEGRQSNAAVYATIAAGTGFVLFLIAIVGLVIEANKA